MFSVRTNSLIGAVVFVRAVFYQSAKIPISTRSIVLVNEIPPQSVRISSIGAIHFQSVRNIFSWRGPALINKVFYQ